MELETFIFEGKTKEEAIEKACKELNLPKERLKIEVLEQGSSGIFGIVGGRKSKIRVKVKKEGDAEDVIFLAKNALENIFAFFRLENMQINSQYSDKGILLKIEGGNDSGILIGKGGRTLDALEFIVNRIVNKKLQKNVRITLDIQNYRERRREYLRKLAISMGEKAKKTGKVIATEPLNARDRRIIHVTLRNDSSVETKSQGEGTLRKVIIIPKAKREDDR